MRPTNLFMVIGLVVGGFIIADFLIHPEGTKQAANGIVAIEKPGVNGLLGYPSK